MKHRMKLKHELLKLYHKLINRLNRSRLNNLNPSVISSNCMGGVMSHWLGLKFNSPFINLWMTNDDFLTAMEHFDEFIATPLVECHDASVDYPVGIGYMDTKVYFMHYKNWDEAIDKWEERKKRIDKNNMAVFLSNFRGVDAESKCDDDTVITRFSKLDFKNKIIFVDRPFPQYKNCIYLKDYHPEKGINVFDLNKKDFYRRYIDQFDYVKFLNNLHN